MRNATAPTQTYRWALFFLLSLVGPLQAEDLGLRVAPGFRVSLYADHELANDIFAMTLDQHGRVVVTGPGYIKVLHHSGTGKADRATLFAAPPTGGMGMCFDGNDLYFCGGGWFSRYRDRTGKGRADGPPEHLLPLAFSEHGGHAMRKGPDGWWYLIGGNDSGIGPGHVTRPSSPVTRPEAGALLRLPPDCRSSEVIAHGFRNPYDFDFNAAGDLFTYDSDVERDFFLPWYSPTRIYHIAYAGHHGWRLPSYLRSWCRKDYYVDTVDILWPVGRGSPTGVTCYRHNQFPKHYQGGFFALDWTFGKVYFFPLEPDGASYKTRPEVFLESVGSNGFDPTDIAVAPDGGLFICMGGRGTRGAVYKVDYVGDGQVLKKRGGPKRSDLEAVLHAHQPLDAWSRAQWMPLARTLGRERFAAVAASETWDAASRTRAIEILTELFGGVSEAAALKLASAKEPLVRSRLAWSLGRAPSTRFGQILRKLAIDSHPHVRCAALHTLADHVGTLEGGLLSEAALENCGHPDKRVRQAAARLTSRLPDPDWQGLWSEALKRSVQVRLTAGLAALWRSPKTLVPESMVDFLLGCLRASNSPDLQLQAIRLIMLALGDYHLKDPPFEVYTGYSLAAAARVSAATRRRIAEAVRPLFPSRDGHLNEESSRLLAMLQDDDAELQARVAEFWTADSSPTRDVHYLAIYSRLRGIHAPERTWKVAQTLLGLHRKLAGREQRTKQVWGERLTEILINLLQHDPQLTNAILEHPDFPQASHVAMAAAFHPQERRRAAHLFLEAAKKDENFTWSGAVIDLFSLLPPDEVYPVLRTQWSEFGLRDAILLQLAGRPDKADRDKFLTGLESNQHQVLHAGLSALQRLPRDATPKNLIPVLRLLWRLEQEPKENELRREVVTLLRRQTGQDLSANESATELAALRKAYEPIFRWFAQEYPELASFLHDTGSEDPAIWNKLLRAVDWTKGDAERGAVLFRSRACQTCHTGARALGPDLTGVTSRFSREDLFTAIIYPSRDVAPAYRTSVIETRSGLTYSGIVAFESADGVILQTGAATTMRIATADIASRVPSNRSLMPDGLLKDLKPSDLADLYRYLQTLKPKTPGTRPVRPSGGQERRTAGGGT